MESGICNYVRSYSSVFKYTPRLASVFNLRNTNWYGENGALRSRIYDCSDNGGDIWGKTFSWNTITFQTLMVDVAGIPAILLGVFIGIKTVKIVPEKLYRYLIIISTVLAALLLL